LFFRIYPLDSKGRYRLPIAVECASDAEAARAGAALRERVKDGFDVWEFSRFAGRFEIGADGEVRAVPSPSGPLAPPA